MSFRLAPKSVTLKSVMALIFRYFTEFVRAIFRCKTTIWPTSVSKSFLIVCDHINMICSIIQQLFGQNKLLTQFDGHRCIDYA